MSSITKYFSFVSLSFVWLFSVFNPLYKKYDYGAGFPVLVFLGGLIGLLLLVEWKRKREEAYLEKFLLGIFALFVLISQFYSVAGNMGWSEVLAFLAIVAIYLLYGHQKNWWSKRFLQVVAWGSLVACLMGVFIYVMRDETRMIGPFFNKEDHSHAWPNAFALFLLMTWPVCVYVFKKRWAQILSVGLVIACLFLSYSRGAVIAFMGQSVLLALFYVKSVSWRKVANVVMVGVVSYALFVGVNGLRAENHRVLDVQEKVNFENDEGLTSKQERVDFWVASFDLMNDRPLVGYGPFTFKYAYRSVQELMLGGSDHPHNMFLKVAVENGLVAFMAWGVFLLAWILTIGQRFKELDDEKKKMVGMVVIAVAGGVAHNLIDYNFNFLATWLLFGLFLVIGRSSVAHVSKRKVNVSIVALLVGVFVFVFAVKEGSLRVLNEVYPQKEFYNYFSYLRDFHLAEADKALGKRDYPEALEFIEKHLEVNEVEAQAYYLRGVIYCDEAGGFFDEELCLENLRRALELNPLDMFRYRYDYARYLRKFGYEEDFGRVLKEGRPLVEEYFYYVENNVHFTAYTDNVEAAGDFIGLYEGNVSEAEWQELVNKREKMFYDSENARSKREF